MSVTNKCLSLFGALAIAGTSIPGETSHTLDEKSPGINLKAGTQVDYTTSCSLDIGGDFNQHDKSELTAVFTILKETGGTRTMFAALDLKPNANDEKQSKGPKSGRFSFELSDNGALSERMAGFSHPLFQGWTPSVYFPPVTVDTKSTVTLVLPLSQAPVEVSVEKMNAPNGAQTVTATYESNEKPGDNAGLTVNSYKAIYNFASPDEPPVSSKIEFKATAKDITGKEGNVALNFESHRTGLSKIPAKDFDVLQKDVAAGIQIAEQLDSLLGAGEEGTSKALALMSDYSKSFPKGAFAQTLGDVMGEISMMGELQANSEKIHEGEKAPAFQAKTVDGETVKLADLRGKVVLLDFWATWCGPCRMEMPNVKKVYEDNKDAGFTIVGISADEDEKALRDVIKSEAIPWKQIREAEPKSGTVMNQYGVMKYPTTVLIDREGIIRMVDARGGELASAVSDLVKEKQ